MGEPTTNLVANEPVEFEKQRVENKDFKKITNRLRRIYGMCLESIKKI
jgi:hypothetical protein